MKKMKTFLVKTSLIMVFSLFLFGCASTPNNFSEIPTDKIPGPGESLITIQCEKSGVGSMIRMKIWIDDEEIASGIKNGKRIHIIIPKGNHMIQAGSTGIDKGNSITFTTIDNEEILFLTKPAMGLFAARFNISETNRRILSN